MSLFRNVFEVPVPGWAKEEAIASLKDTPRYWALSGWFPRHFEMVFLADVYKEMARIGEIQPKVLSFGCGEGFTEYLLALEDVSVVGIDKEPGEISKALSYKKLFDKVKKSRQLNSTLDYKCGKFEDLACAKYPDYKMVLASWVGPSKSDVGVTHYDLREKIIKSDPELVVINGERGCVLDEYTPINLHSFGYHCVESWYSATAHVSSLLDRYTSTGNGVAIVEVWTIEGLPCSQRFKNVPPYQWEARLRLNERQAQFAEHGMYDLMLNEELSSR